MLKIQKKNHKIPQKCDDFPNDMNCSLDAILRLCNHHNQLNDDSLEKLFDKLKSSKKTKLTIILKLLRNNCANTVDGICLEIISTIHMTTLF